MKSFSLAKAFGLTEIVLILEVGSHWYHGWVRRFIMMMLFWITFGKAYTLGPKSNARSRGSHLDQGLWSVDLELIWSSYCLVIIAYEKWRRYALLHRAQQMLPKSKQKLNQNEVPFTHKILTTYEPKVMRVTSMEEDGAPHLCRESSESWFDSRLCLEFLSTLVVLGLEFIFLWRLSCFDFQTKGLQRERRRDRVVLNVRAQTYPRGIRGGRGHRTRYLSFLLLSPSRSTHFIRPIFWPLSLDVSFRPTSWPIACNGSPIGFVFSRIGGFGPHLTAGVIA